MTKPSGYVIYEGPSLIDGKPIVAIAIPKSGNTKTGGMMQTYIMRSDIDPRDANKTGADYSICGNCPHRGKPTMDPKRKLAEGRTCYVVMGQGPLIVYRTYKAGKYPRLSGHAALAALGADKAVRIGTYGDGAAVPSYIWESLLTDAERHTAYSHQSGMDGAAYDPNVFMRSADTLQDAQAAWSKGERTFRVVGSVYDIVAGKEILCPASEEAGKRTTCERCGLCGGASVAAKSIAIPVHGAGKGHFVAA